MCTKQVIFCAVLIAGLSGSVRAASDNSIEVVLVADKAGDLSEAIAAKTALQAAGHELAIKLVEKTAALINKKDK